MIAEITAVTFYIFGAILMFAIIDFGIDYGRLEKVTAKKYQLFCVVIWPAIMLIFCFDLVKEKIKSWLVGVVKALVCGSIKSE